MGGGGLGTRAAVSLTLILTLGCPLRSNQGAVLSPKKDPWPDKGLLQVLTLQRAFETRVLWSVDMRASVSPA